MARPLHISDKMSLQFLAPLSTTCLTCGKAAHIAYHTERTVTTLEGQYRLHVAVRQCTSPECPRHHRAYRPEAEQHDRVAMLDANNNPNVYFPSSPKEELRNKIWDLANLWIPSKLPRKADVNVWYEIIWETSSKLSLEVVTKYVQDKRCLEKLEEDLVKPADPVGWLNSYYKLINQDEAWLGAIIKNQYAVIPNQNGIFKKVSELKLDEQIEEELKNVLSF